MINLPSLIVEPEQDHTEVTAGRVGAGVTETEIEGDEGALVSDCSSEYEGSVWPTRPSSATVSTS
jgi:hypothetical protein